MQTTEAITTASEQTIQRALSVTPTVVASLGSNGPVASVREELRVETKTSTGAGSDDKAKEASSSSIPLYVKVGGMAVALGLLWLVVWLWRRSSGAVEAAWQAGDRGIASLIEQVEGKLRECTEPNEMVRLNAELARLEKQRGKLAAQGGGK